jgi:hypothetical protein
VVVYGADFTLTANGPFIQGIQFFDPWPSRGNTSAAAGPFAQMMTYYIVVRAQK